MIECVSVYTNSMTYMLLRVCMFINKHAYTYTRVRVNACLFAEVTNFCNTSLTANSASLNLFFWGVNECHQSLNTDALFVIVTCLTPCLLSTYQST